MRELTVSAGKFHLLLDYLDQIGLDAAQVAAAVHLNAGRLERLAEDTRVPALQYGLLYKAAVRAMEALGHPIPWAAGLGSDAFELMCRCIITARTLGEALDLAQRFHRLLYPQLRYRLELLDDGRASTVRLAYHIDEVEAPSALAPAHWERTEFRLTVARASGLKVWGAFCGWLTGQPLHVEALHIAAPYLNDAYHEALVAVFRCPVHFAAADNTLTFAREDLDRRLVHTAASLAEFLDSSVYHLLAVDQLPASTSTAIKSLISIDLPRGLPSFASVARSLHMSESSLRRRLLRENTSYQALKDEVRCEIAIDRLLNRDEKVADIASYLGFTESSSFVRSFKSWTGQTPHSYRERFQSLGGA